jgi:hypothetical protein
MSPQRSSRETNPHDEVPVKQVKKKFEELLEEQLSKNPTFKKIDENSELDLPSLSNKLNVPCLTDLQSLPSSPNPKFLKRGEGHLCTYTRSQSSSQLRTLRSRFCRNESPEKGIINLEKITQIKEQLQQKNNELKKEEKELVHLKKVEMEELKRIRIEKSRERRYSPQREELEQLKKIILKMQTEEKTKECKHQEEVRKLNIEILKLRQKVAELERKATQNKTHTGFYPSSRMNPLGMTPLKKNGEYQGKIQKFVEKNKLNSARKVRKENFILDPFDSLSFDSREYN